MKNLVLSFLAGVIVGAIIMFFLKKGTVKEILVPIQFDIEAPIIEVEKDTIYLPEPIKGEVIIDSTYYDKYKSLKDSISKDSLFKEVIKINEYKELIEDDTLKIDLYMKSRGEVLSYKVNYKTKPYNIAIDTILPVNVPSYPEFYAGLTPLIPYKEENIKVSIKPTINYINAKHTLMYNLEVDFINKSIESGILMRF